MKIQKLIEEVETLDQLESLMGQEWPKVAYKKMPLRFENPILSPTSGDIDIYGGKGAAGCN